MRTHPFIAIVLGGLAGGLGLACGGSGDSNLAGSDGPNGNQGIGASDGGAGADGTVSNGDPGSGSRFTATPTGDAGTVVLQGVCAAGVYQGQFMTYVGAGADGGSPGLFSLMWNGNLTIDLSSQKITMTSASGGEVPTTTSTTTLSIADGGALDGSDNFGGSFFADMNGTLDCSPDAGPPFHLSATLFNGDYKSAFYEIPLIGSLTADYQEAGAGSPPKLVNGALLVAGTFNDGGVYSSASGTWSATWVSP